MAMGTADNAASTPVIDREVVQAESSESSSGHSDKDWIRYSGADPDVYKIGSRFAFQVHACICGGNLRFCTRKEAMLALQYK